MYPTEIKSPHWIFEQSILFFFHVINHQILRNDFSFVDGIKKKIITKISPSGNVMEVWLLLLMLLLTFIINIFYSIISNGTAYLVHSYMRVLYFVYCNSNVQTEEGFCISNECSPRHCCRCCSTSTTIIYYKVCTPEQ